MKIHPRLLFLLATLFGGFTAPAPAQTPSTAPVNSTVSAPETMQPSVTTTQAIDPAKIAEIRKLLQLTGTSKLMAQMKTRMIEMFKSQRPGVPDEVWSRLDSEMNTDELVEKLIPLYDKYYTLDDLKAVNAFYESPAGQKMVTTNPQIVSESMKIGQEWGQGVGMKVDEEIAREKSAPAPTATPVAPAPPTTK